MTEDADPRASLIAKLQAAGCPNPESWADSEIEENIPQFALFTFLKALWSIVPPAESQAWRLDALPNDDGAGGAGRRLAESTADPADLATLVRAAKAEAVRDAAFLLDGYLPTGGEPAAHWQLFEVNDDCESQSIRSMSGLHECVDDPDVAPPDLLDPNA